MKENKKGKLPLESVFLAVFASILMIQSGSRAAQGIATEGFGYFKFPIELAIAVAAAIVLYLGLTVLSKRAREKKS